MAKDRTIELGRRLSELTASELLKQAPDHEELVCKEIHALCHHLVKFAELCCQSSIAKASKSDLSSPVQEF